MPNLELTGRIVKFLPVQQGVSARGEWCKQEFVIEFQDGNFPGTAVFNVWGPDKVQDLSRFQIGQDVKVSFGINSREFNGRYYTDLRAWRVEATVVDATTPVAQPQVQHPGPSNVPAGFGPIASAPVAPPVGNPAGDQTDDLPF